MYDITDNPTEITHCKIPTARENLDNKVGGHLDWETKFKRKCTGIIVPAEMKKHYKWIIYKAGSSGLGKMLLLVFFPCFSVGTVARIYFLKAKCCPKALQPCSPLAELY